MTLSRGRGRELDGADVIAGSARKDLLRVVNAGHVDGESLFARKLLGADFARELVLLVHVNNPNVIVKIDSHLELLKEIFTYTCSGYNLGRD